MQLSIKEIRESLRVGDQELIAELSLSSKSMVYLVLTEQRNAETEKAKKIINTALELLRSRDELVKKLGECL